MEKELFLKAMKFVIDDSNLTDEDRAILKAYFDEIPDAITARKLKVKITAIRGKRQNICAKLGHDLIKTGRMIENSMPKFS